MTTEAYHQRNRQQQAAYKEQKMMWQHNELNTNKVEDEEKKKKTQENSVGFSSIKIAAQTLRLAPFYYWRQLQSRHQAAIESP